MDIVWVALIVIVFLIAGIFIGWPILLRRFVHEYYRKQYNPQDITKEQMKETPPEVHLSDVPWISAPIQVCQSTSLQMIAARYGADYPRPHLDFLMGFTYGASRFQDAGFMPFGADPELGLALAAPYLGLQRRYYTTDDPRLFLSALRLFLAGGQPVRLALDMGTLYGHNDFIAHSIVVVGYAPGTFYYYETVARPPAEIDAARRPPGEIGLPVSEDILLSAVKRMSVELKYPWLYSLTVFEPGPESEDLRPVWAANARAIVDESKYGPKMGVRVIEELADEIAKNGKRFRLQSVREGVELAAQVRQDNADFLRAVFPNDVELLEASGLFEQAVKEYRMALADIENGLPDQIKANRIAARLRNAASAERKVAEIFAKRGKS